MYSYSFQLDPFSTVLPWPDVLRSFTLTLFVSLISLHIFHHKQITTLFNEKGRFKILLFSPAALITAKMFDGFEPIGFRSSYEWLIVSVHRGPRLDWMNSVIVTSYRRSSSFHFFRSQGSFGSLWPCFGHELWSLLVCLGRAFRARRENRGRRALFFSKLESPINFHLTNL